MSLEILLAYRYKNFCVEDDPKEKDIGILKICGFFFLDWDLISFLGNCFIVDDLLVSSDCNGC